MAKNMSFLQSQEFRKERSSELKLSVFEWLKMMWHRIIEWKVWARLTSLVIAGIFFGFRIIIFIVEKTMSLSHVLIERFRKHRSK